jgi:TonB family protein
MTQGFISGAVAGSLMIWPIQHPVNPVTPVILYVILYMTDHHNKKHFLNLPKFTGGSEAFRKFIADNLSYPQEALEARIEGSVVVGYDISDEGSVINPHILKGLGYGCDEEAIRVIGLLSYEKVKNRGVRVRTTTKTTIHFKLPQSGFTISYSSSVKVEPEQKKDGPVTYEYTINF